jgi:hypothetical protein
MRKKANNRDAIRIGNCNSRLCITSLMKGDREMMAKMVVCSRHDDFLLVEIVYLGV